MSRIGQGSLIGNHDTEKFFFEHTAIFLDRIGSTVQAVGPALAAIAKYSGVGYVGGLCINGISAIGSLVVNYRSANRADSIKQCADRAIGIANQRAREAIQEISKTRNAAKEVALLGIGVAEQGLILSEKVASIACTIFAFSAAFYVSDGIPSHPIIATVGTVGLIYVGAHCVRWIISTNEEPVDPKEFTLFLQHSAESNAQIKKNIAKISNRPK